MTSIKTSKRKYKQKMPIGVFKINGYPSPQEQEQIKQAIQKEFGKTNRFLLVCGDIDYIPFNRKRSDKVLQLRSLKNKNIPCLQ